MHPRHHRLSEPWLRWRGVAHVLNCMGRFDVRQEELPEWAIVHDPHYAFRGISFFDWCIRSHVDRREYERTFTRLRSALSQPSSVVYIHCKSGRDRSCQTVYAFLRIAYGLDDRTATEALSSRHSVDGAPLANLQMDENTQAWLQETVKAML